MAVGRTATLTNVRPLGLGDHKAFIRQGTLGATTQAGEVIALQSDGKWDPAIATGVVLFAGVAMQSGGDGDPVDVCLYGPVEVLTGGTIGAAVYIGDTAGEYSDTAGTKSYIIGYAETATILFVNPQPVALS